MAYLHYKVAIPTVPRLIRRASDSKTNAIRVPPNRVLSLMYLIRQSGHNYRSSISTPGF